MAHLRESRSRAPAEVRIAYEVAMHLRILPRFSDDGAPEGTVDRPVSVDPTVQRVEVIDEEDEVEILLDPPA